MNILDVFEAAGVDRKFLNTGLYNEERLVQLSIATSLKRIADNLDAITQHNFNTPAIRVASVA